MFFLIFNIFMQVGELGLHGINSVLHCRLISRNRLNKRFNLKITITDLWTKPFCIQISCLWNVISMEHSSLHLPAVFQQMRLKQLWLLNAIMGRASQSGIFTSAAQGCDHQGQRAHSTLAHTKEVKRTFCAGEDVSYGISWLL